MTSHDLAQTLNKLAVALSSQNYLVEVLSKINTYYQVLLPHMVGVAGASSQGENNEQVGSVQGTLSEINDELKQLQLGKVFVELHKLENAVAELGAPFDSIDNEPLLTLLVRSRKFYGDFETYISSYSRSKTLRLLASGKELYDYMLSTQFISVVVKDALEHSIETPYGYQKLLLVLGSSVGYRELLSKLSALNEIYSEFCILLGVSETQYPLEIVKIESGSTWIQILGEVGVISMIATALKSAATYLYRTRTTEGKLSAIPKQVEVIDSVLQLTEKLEEKNIDTSTLKDSIQKASIKIATRLNDLLADELYVRIDKDSYSVLEVDEGRKLNEKRMLLLEDGGNKVGNE